MQALFPAELISPEYWGVDIGDPNVVETEDSPNQPRLNCRAYTLATRFLGNGIAEIIEEEGVQEIQYTNGNVLDSGNVTDGSVVVIESEGLQKHFYGDNEDAWKRSFDDGDPDLSRPYTQYWLNHQDGSGRPQRHVGWRRAAYLNQHMLYGRLVQWGVVLTNDGQRGIQPFNFNATALRADGAVGMHRYSKRNSAVVSAFLPLPITIGDTTVTRKSVTPQAKRPDAITQVNQANRISAIDIVRTAPPEPRRTRRKLALGRVALPQVDLGLSQC